VTSGYLDGVTASSERVRRAPAALDPLTSALGDIVCWLVFYLHQCEDDEVDLEVADELSTMVGERLKTLTVGDRLRFLEHAALRANDSRVDDYQEFLMELAETLGLE
jgi:hypothetical protein